MPWVTLITGCLAGLAVFTLPHAPQDPHEPFYALIAQLIGWSAIIVAAACTVPPLDREFLVKPPANPHSIAIGWYAVAAAALILTCAAMRDHWHRHTRSLRRLPSLTRLLPASCGGGR
jgi:hypothetical protein